MSLFRPDDSHRGTGWSIEVDGPSDPPSTGGPWSAWAECSKPGKSEGGINVSAQVATRLEAIFECMAKLCDALAARWKEKS